MFRETSFTEVEIHFSNLQYAVQSDVELIGNH
jgi:hypothetical protein